MRTELLDRYLLNSILIRPTWHNGYGGGIWIAPLNLIPLSFELAQSDEGSQFYFRLGYLF